MTELVEYALVVLVSSLFVAGSVATYDGFNAFEGRLQLGVDTASVARLANEAISNGTSRAAVSMQASTVSCRDGILSVTAHGRTQSSQVAAGCDFLVRVGSGVHTLTFAYEGTRLSMAAS